MNFPVGEAWVVVYNGFAARDDLVDADWCVFIRWRMILFSTVLSAREISVIFPRTEVLGFEAVIPLG